MPHVLIIEDEPLVALDIESILSAEGATSFDFADTEEAAIQAAIAHRPELITSDVKLVRGTGPRAVDAIHRRYGDIPVIFITGTPEACTPCNPPGVIVAKPLNRRQITGAYHELIAG